MKKLLIPVIAIIVTLTSCSSDFEESLGKSIDASIDEAMNENEYAAAEEVKEESSANIFSSKDGRFKINFSGEPKESSDIISTEAGDIEMTTYLYEKSVTEAYMVAYNDYPSELVKNTSIDVMLDGAKDGSSSSMGITIFDLEENLKIEGNPGRHFKGNNGSYYVEYKLFLKGNRLYQIAIIRDGSYATEERTKDFFGSFKLIED